MLIEEVIVEAATTTYAKKGNRTVRKYRCTSGSRKGRIVAKASTCTAPKNVKKGNTLKKTKRKQSSNIKAKTSRTKRANPASRRVAKLNRRKGKGRRI